MLAKKSMAKQASPAPATIAPAVNPAPESRAMTLKVVRVTVNAYGIEHAKRLVAATYGLDYGAVIEAIPATTHKKSTANKCTSADFPQRGTRHWETEYQIWTYSHRINVGLKKVEYLGLELVKGGFDEKVPAVKAMKELCLKHSLPMMVQIHKVLVKDTNVAFVAEPDMAMFQFHVDFRQV